MVSHIQELVLLLMSQDAPATQGCGGDSFSQLGPLFLMLPIFYFLVIGPARKEKQKHQTMLEALKRGDEIVTTSGMLATIVDIDDVFMTLEVSKGVKVKLLKGSIASRYAPKADPKKEEAKA